MAPSKLLLFSVFLALSFTGITAYPPPPDDGASDFAQEVADSSLALQLQQLKSRVSLLESRIDDKNRELRKKDESIKLMEKVIQEKSNSIALLQSAIESVQGREPLDVVELGDKPHVQAGGLEKQVKRLREDITVQNKKRDELEARASVAEQKIPELSIKLENIRYPFICGVLRSRSYMVYTTRQSLRKVNDEQKTGIRKTEHDLQVAEEEMVKEKFGISSISEDLTEVHGGWLPHTFGVHVDYFQTYILTYWNELGRPAFNLGIEKALKMKARGEGWTEIIIKRIRTNWMPRLKKQSLEFKAYLEPNIRLVTAKTVDVYRSSKSSIGPLVFKAQNMADPYIQEAKKYTKPYIDPVAMVAKPHLDKLHIALKPYTEMVLNAYRKVITTTTFLHHEVKEILKNNELTQPVASMELAWFAATALLALPAVFLFKFYSAIFGKKTKKRSHSSYVNYTRRRLKRAHPGST
ncbi:uncharacterized protein LOC125480833 isoform X2 [Pyrus x bretschneideri]|uniref:uncharacterized protein LOC125480833 isoform X2 n=1 Tax=Pyrus x bretschneideri TaxID=225117 RepID=UPI00202FF152|nr:uncharacterized protein LOC125480833 isoform X2 [Pyrus x bretschneideri]